jgi:hypothetical protein
VNEIDNKSKIIQSVLVITSSFVCLSFVSQRFFQNQQFSEFINTALVLAVLVSLAVAFFFTRGSTQNFGFEKKILIALVSTSFVPLLLPATYPGNSLTWIIATIGAACFFFMSRHMSGLTVWHLLGWLNIGSILTIFLGPSAFSEDVRSIIFSARLTGLLGHPNVTGFLAAVTVVYALDKNRLLSLYSLSAMFVVVVTFSLTSIGCLLIGSLIILLQRSGKRSIPILSKLLFWVSTLVAVAPFIGVVLLNLRLTPELLTNRASIWNWLKDNGLPPLEGFGAGFLSTFQSAGVVPWSHAHNQFFMSYFSHGLLGLFLVSLFIYFLARGVWESSSPPALAFFSMLMIESTTEIPLFLDYPGGKWIATVIVLIIIGQNVFKNNLKAGYVAEDSSHRPHSLLGFGSKGAGL